MLPWTYLIFGLLGGVLVGWLLSYWFTASRQNQVALRLEDELRGQLDQKETEIKTLRKELEIMNAMYTHPPKDLIPVITWLKQRIKEIEKKRIKLVI